MLDAAYLLDFDNNVWELPYALILNHTVEEIIGNAESSFNEQKNIEKILKKVKIELMLSEVEATEPFFIPKKIPLAEFIKESSFVFIGLHGGEGENGTFQKMLSDEGLKFNGSDEATSRLCMDKYNTGEFVRSAGIEAVTTASQKVVLLKDMLGGGKDLKIEKVKELWCRLQLELSAKTIIVKPKDDGCSTGVAHLYRDIDLVSYLSYLTRHESTIPKGTLFKQDNILEMPSQPIKEVLFEKFIRTDYVHFKGNKIKYTRKDGWIEVTIGILEIDGKLHAFNPSVTIAEGEVLSVEEKFQGGTGINLTPPPKEIAKRVVVQRARKRAEELATKIGIKNYARIDAFMNVTTGALIIIEVNTLPALTPSTVLYQQALAENPQIFPLQLLEIIIQNAGY